MRNAEPERGPRLWYDLTCIARHEGAAVGVQRAAAGLAIGLRDPELARAIRFCRFDRNQGFLVLADAEVNHLLGRLERGVERAPGGRRAIDRVRERLMRRVPPRAPFAPGDFLINPGFATYKARHQAEVAALLESIGVRYVGFIYDLVPLLLPEWWRLDRQSRSREWVSWTGRNAAVVLCCSDATRRDAVRFFADAKIETGPIETFRLGDEIPRSLPTEPCAPVAASSGVRPYVLYVSTLEVRKNHRLLLEVWRRLIAAHGPDRVPELVFVGRKGWRVDDFVAELAQSRFLDGKIVWHQRVDDARLARLYSECLFTVYPSLYEGWGLPVAESLAFGKCCVASSAASLPEVGREFVDYHDPSDVAEATSVIERAIFDAPYREAREKMIRERFRTRTWRESAAELLDRIDREAPRSRAAI
jgi:glycosyltransferase involved in cell wall biosynthesis